MGCNKIILCAYICRDTHSENYLLKIVRGFSRCFQANFKMSHQCKANRTECDQKLHISSFDTEPLDRLVATWYHWKVL